MVAWRKRSQERRIEHEDEKRNAVCDVPGLPGSGPCASGTGEFPKPDADCAIGTTTPLGLYLRMRQTGWKKVHTITNQGAHTKIDPDTMLLNNSGDILVSYTMKAPDTFQFRALLWKDGKEFSIGGTEDVQHLAMNNAGTVVGQISPASSDHWKPFLFQNDRRWDLNALIQNKAKLSVDEPVAINNRGDILGWGSGDATAVLLEASKNAL